MNDSKRLNTAISRDSSQNVTLELPPIYHVRSTVTFSCSPNTYKHNVRTFSVSVKL